ncbi:FUSC family protein [Mycolicibacterium mucogenicum]|uniref:FUSC family protein n=1 Tax=Mycolicibacterium mucogenicum TaxID=56689 RepID=A0A4R5W9E8_MYCMU|nr:FUSC family protein [Mycolicibacterium mucogenicum]MCX8557208.1 FUSC family protein [Mycolicibacterium mucogenicum]TDK85693.1 FUSC family protein [Mycolicibacterium mucogenicum]
MEVATAVRRASVLNAADPGRIRLRSAAATTFSLLLAIGAMLAFTRAAGQPVTVAMLGAVVAMQASAAVKDRDQRSRNITTLLLFFPAIGAMALAAFLAPHGKIVDVGFIAVLFAAVWVRRYGPRGNALGMVAFISYFFVMFLRTPVHQIPVLAVAVAVGIASSLLVHVLLFPERPRVEARRLLSALRAASLSTLDVATRRGQVSVDVARHELDQLGETALLIDDWLDRYEAAKSLSVTSKDLALRVFEAQIMLEQAASFLWWLDQDEPWPEGLVDAVAALRICLDNNPTEEQLRQARRMGAAAADKADLSTSAGVATVTAYRAMQAHLAIHHITTNARGISDDDIAAAAAAVEADGDDGQDAPSGLDPSTKAAIQVAVATSAATVLGNLISPDRGYWAVLTAFLVFTGVSTRGEILSRAGHRIVGTIAGVVAGVLLAAEIGRNPALQIVVLVVCVFFAFYLATVAYFWLTFFVTVLLAMLYGLLGNFSAQVLEVRIAETAVGSLVGIASAYFVFSTKTRATFVEKVNDYLDHMERVIDTAVTAVLTAGDAGDLVADTRRMDNALKEAVTAGKPLQMGPLSELRHGVRRLMRGLQVANRSAHALARAGVTASHVGPPLEGADDALHQAAARAVDAIARVRKLVAGDDVRNEKRSEAAVFDVGLPEMRPGPVRASVRALNMLDRALTEVTTRV